MLVRIFNISKFHSFLSSFMLYSYFLVSVTVVLLFTMQCVLCEHTDWNYNFCHADGIYIVLP